MSIIKRAALAALATTAVLGTVATVAPSGEASAALAVCRDSNGSRPGGSVYVRYGDPLGCDIVRPVRLHEVRVPSRAACDHAGGRGWTSSARICWDIDV